METYGYIRVSTKDQNLGRQFASMYKMGLDDAHIFDDKQSGKNFSRPAYEELLSIVKPGDLILFHSLDRMGRDYEEMGKQWQHITTDLKVNVKVLDMPLLDTTNKHNDITMTFMSDMVFKLLTPPQLHRPHREGEDFDQAEGGYQGSIGKRGAVREAGKGEACKL